MRECIGVSFKLPGPLCLGVASEGLNVGGATHEKGVRKKRRVEVEPKPPAAVACHILQNMIAAQFVWEWIRPFSKYKQG